MKFERTAENGKSPYFWRFLCHRIRQRKKSLKNGFVSFQRLVTRRVRAYPASIVASILKSEKGSVPSSFRLIYEDRRRLCSQGRSSWDRCGKTSLSPHHLNFRLVIFTSYLYREVEEIYRKAWCLWSRRGLNSQLVARRIWILMYTTTDNYQFSELR